MKTSILDFKRIEECIGLTMMFLFYLFIFLMLENIFHVEIMI